MLRKDLALVVLFAALFSSAWAADKSQNDISTTSFNDIAPMVIIGEGWSVQIIIQNLEDSTTVGVLRFFRANGEPWDLPLTSHQTLNAELPLIFFPHQLVVVETIVSFGFQQLGWAYLDTDCCGDMSAQVVFRRQEADRPDLMTTTPFGASFTKTTVYFDNTDRKYTGVGVVNSDRIFSFGDNQTTATVLIRNAAGNVVSRKSRIIPNQNFHWFNLAADYPETANIRGSITFESDDFSYLTAFSLQFTPNGAFTSITSADSF